MNKLLLVLAGVLLFVSSCNRKIGAVFPKREKFEIIDPEFKYLSSKAKFRFDNDGKNVSATANFRIKRDSIIWISISGLGLEAARVFIDREQVRVLDRLKRQYYEYTFDQLSDEYGFDLNFNMVQAVLLGNLLEPYRKQKLHKASDYYSYKDTKGHYQLENFIGTRSLRLEKVNVTDPKTKSTISVNYSDFVLVNDQIFPNQISAVIDYESAKKPETEIYISYNKMEIESSPLKFPYSVSSKYERK